jgi:hypothetical protein
MQINARVINSWSSYQQVAVSSQLRNSEHGGGSSLLSKQPEYKRPLKNSVNLSSNSTSIYELRRIDPECFHDQCSLPTVADVFAKWCGTQQIRRILLALKALVTILSAAGVQTIATLLSINIFGQAGLVM